MGPGYLKKKIQPIPPPHSFREGVLLSPVMGEQEEQYVIFFFFPSST